MTILSQECWSFISDSSDVDIPPRFKVLSYHNFFGQRIIQNCVLISLEAAAWASEINRRSYGIIKVNIKHFIK